MVANLERLKIDSASLLNITVLVSLPYNNYAVALRTTPHVCHRGRMGVPVGGVKVTVVPRLAFTDARDNSGAGRNTWMYSIVSFHISMRLMESGGHSARCNNLTLQKFAAKTNIGRASFWIRHNLYDIYSLYHCTTASILVSMHCHMPRQLVGPRKCLSAPSLTARIRSITSMGP